jgi:transcriptional regulator with GAF, ATPase, and Fis domain
MTEQQLTEAFVEMADTLVDDFDLMDFLHVLTDRCVSLLGVSAAGLLLTDQRGALRLVAASSEQTRLLELFQVQIDEGPCLECFHSGQPVAVADLAAAAQRWPRFVPAARSTGFAAVHALPMRLRSEVIGALNLFTAQAQDLVVETLRLGRALADVATIGLLQARTIRQRDALTEQLQTALNTRVLIEQAKGVIAERHQVDMDGAFNLLRASARNHNRRLADLSRAVVEGSETV